MTPFEWVCVRVLLQSVCEPQLEVYHVHVEAGEIWSHVEVGKKLKVTKRRWYRRARSLASSAALLFAP